MQQAFVNLRTGNPGKLPRPIEDFAKRTDPAARAMVDQALSVSATGSPRTVERALADLVHRYQPNEVILTGQIHDHAARKRSFAIAAEAMKAIGSARDAA